jgi:predicted nuclease of predicted toxin-antitoxin system
MKLFADENLPRGLVIWLRQESHDVLYASETLPGAPDSSWLNQAQAEGRIILTSDKDFGDLVFRDRLTSHGIILLRLGAMPLKDRLSRLEKVWTSVESDPAGKFIVITPTKIRIRDFVGEETA